MCYHFQVGRHFDQARYDMAIRTQERQEREACEMEQERKMIKELEMCDHRERFIKKSNEKIKFVKIRNKMKDELHLHQLALENRQDKYYYPSLLDFNLRLVQNHERTSISSSNIYTSLEMCHARRQSTRVTAQNSVRIT
jgi:hypothetical protein